jgi:hypothetical protein
VRLFLSLTVCLLMSVYVRADESSKGAKQSPTEDEIVNQCGGRLAKIFAKFGTPENVTVDGANDGGVDLDYGPFGFKIEKKFVTVCFFWDTWKGAVKGVKIGDDQEQAVKVLGTNTHDFKREDGLQDYGWDLKDPDAVLWVNFNKDKKAKQINIELK